MLIQLLRRNLFQPWRLIIRAWNYVTRDLTDEHFWKIFLLIHAIIIYIIMIPSPPQHHPVTNSLLPKPFMTEAFGNFEPRETVRIVKNSPGEGGQPYRVESSREVDVTMSYLEYGMNMVCSDGISLNRSILDTRLKECQHWNYPEDLPNASVIIIFHNEGLSVVLRTVQSVINRTPPQLLHEVLLVDDFSSKTDLGIKLEGEIKKWKGKVRLIRNIQRQGLIRTKNRGAKEATGEVIVFLDAHCEVNLNWLPPLLAPIYIDHSVMTVPTIDVINHETFEYTPANNDEDFQFRGIFDWGMLYKETELPYREDRLRKYKSEPYTSPTHAGGLFAINREYFLKLGAYDPGLLVWGGENFELSFKIWQCGGGILQVPCSRVGHVYRDFVPYDFGKLDSLNKGSLVAINYKRVVETWFDDEHKEYFYTKDPVARYLDMGNIAEQLALKDKLKCKSFSWYMDNVAYQVYDIFQKPPPNKYWGSIRSVPGNLCLDSMGYGEVGRYLEMAPCESILRSQIFRLNIAGQLSIGEWCVENGEEGVIIDECKPGSVNGPWIYQEDLKMLKYRKLNKCLSIHPTTKDTLMVPCDRLDNYQKWTINQILYLPA